jgi:hypothetical protein
MCFSCSSSKAAGSGGQAAQTLTSQPYTLQPGEEKFYCYTTTLANDVVVTGFAPTYGKATHHILFARTLAAEPDGFSECDVLFKTTWAPMFVGGVDTTPLRFPPGVGVKLQAGTQLLLQLHLLNATAATITGQTGVTMQLAADPNAALVPAGIWAIDDRRISLPPAAAGAASMHCTADKTLDVFALFGHMHRLGTHIQLLRNGGDVLYDAPWTFDLQPITPATMTIQRGDDLALACTYFNSTPQTVTYGESTANEMCTLVFYYTPFDMLDGCVQK